MTNLTPSSIFNELPKSNQKRIKKAEKGNAKSIMYVANGFILGNNNFPINKEIGIAYLKYGCECGLIDVMEQYGTYLQIGDIIPKDEEKAIEYLNKVSTVHRDSKRKLELVELILSHCSYDIDSTANENVNYVLAKQICQEAVNLGDIAAMREYGKLCMKQKSNKYGEIKADFHEAYKYFSIAAHKGDPEAMFLYGRFNEFGLSCIDINLKEAQTYFKKAHEKGNLGGTAYYAFSLISKDFGQPNELEGLRLLNYAVSRNDPYALNVKAYLISNSMAGYEKNEEMEFELTEKASKTGVPFIFCNMGYFYKYGVYVQQDIQKAIRYYELAFEEGSEYAAYELAKTYSSDEYGIAVDNEKAIKYYKIAIEYGYRKSIGDYCFLLHQLAKDKTNPKIYQQKIIRYSELGRKLKDTSSIRLYAAFLLDGIVVDLNQKKGVELLKEAVDLGDKEAIQTLLDIYENGDKEIQKDPKEAAKYRKMIDPQQSKCCLLI